MEKVKRQLNNKQQSQHYKNYQNLNKIRIELDCREELKNVIKEKQYTIPIFIPHYGCKNECIFCNQRKISGLSNVQADVDIEKDIEYYLEKFRGYKNKIQIAFFGGSFTGLELEKQEKYLKLAYKYINSGQVDSIRLSTRPDYITSENLELLKKYKVKSIELGVQSMDDEVLSKAKRGHNSLQVLEATNLIKSFGFVLGFQIMVGLPDSTLEKEITTINKLLELKPNELRIYPVYVIEPSELFDMYSKGEYIPLELEEAINRSYEILKQCQSSDVKIIRLGLQSTSEISQNNCKIIGPICDNFAEYVTAKIVLAKLEKIIVNAIKVNKDLTRVEIKPLHDIPHSLIVGPKKVNKNYIKTKYSVDIKIVDSNK